MVYIHVECSSCISDIHFGDYSTNNEAKMVSQVLRPLATTSPEKTISIPIQGEQLSTIITGEYTYRLM